MFFIVYHELVFVHFVTTAVAAVGMLQVKPLKDKVNVLALVLLHICLLFFFQQLHAAAWERECCRWGH